MGVPRRHVAGPLLGLIACLSGGLIACSGAASTDFALDAAASRDATTPPATSSTEMDATSPVVDAGKTDDDSAATDASAPPEAGVTPDSGGGGATDSGEAGPSLCSMICMGCCDAMGKCRTGNAMAVCGAAGGTCEDCSAHKCTTLTEAPCCGAKGCGCGVAGLLGCN